MFRPIRLRHTVVMLLTAAAVLASAPEARAERSVAKEQYIIKATNDYRRARGLPPLVANARLTVAAFKHARNMATQDILSHVLDGQGPADRIKAEGYFFRAWAENIGYRQGYPNPEADQMRGWQQSPGHNANLLNPNVTEIGVGAFRNAQGKWYFCQVFAQPLSPRSTTSARATLSGDLAQDGQLTTTGPQLDNACDTPLRLEARADTNARLAFRSTQSGISRVIAARLRFGPTARESLVVC